MQRIDEQFMKYPFYGSRQMVRQLLPEGVAVSRHRVRRLMHLMGLGAIYQAPRTSEPHPAHRVYLYLLRGMAIETPNRVWCADITDILVQLGFPNLVAIVDRATRRALAWRLSNSMDASFRVDALKEAPGPLRQPGYLQHRPGQPVHQLRLHRCAQGRGCYNLHGRPGPLHGQHLHQAPMAVAQI